MNYILYLGVLVVGSAIFCLAAWRKHPSAFGFAIVLIGFSRVIPASSPAMWWGADHYWYWLLTKPIVQTGHIVGQPGQYASSANPRFETVIFNILAATIRAITGITNLEILHTYLPLILALGFFLGGLLILTQIFPTYQALIGTYLYTMLDVTIIESLTFTQFGFFATISLFFIAVYYLGSQLAYWPRMITTLIFVGAVALSHVVASIVIASWILAYNIIVLIYNQLPTPNLPWQLQLKGVYTGLFIIIFMSSIQLFLLNNFFEVNILGIYREIFAPVQPSVTGIERGGLKNPGLIILDYGTIISKLVFGGGAVIAFVMHLRGNLSDRYEKIATLAVVVLVASVVGYFISSDVFGRLLMFSYILLIGTFLAGLLNLPCRQIIPRTIITVILVSLILLNVPAGIAPSIIDEDVDINDDGYHQVTPIEREGPVAGQWLAKYHDHSQTVASGRYYSPIVFYYGDTRGITFPHITNPYSGTVLIDPERDLTVRFESVRYYDNGRVTFQNGQNMMIIPENASSNTNDKRR
jgi:hypothetical protein